METFIEDVMEERIKKLILENYGIEVLPSTSLSEVVEDSLSKIELIFELEKELGSSIPQDEVLDIETFGDLFFLLKRLKNE